MSKNERISALESQLADALGRISELQLRVAALEATRVRREPFENEWPTWKPIPWTCFGESVGHGSSYDLKSGAMGKWSNQGGSAR